MADLLPCSPTIAKEGIEMTDAQWIDGLYGQRNTDLSLTQAQAVQRMLTNGDLLHIDGAFMRALADLAETDAAEYLGLSIARRRGGEWVISDGGDTGIVDSAIEALMVCQDHRDPFKPSQLHDPEPPTYDEALAAKVAAKVREDDARALK